LASKGSGREARVRSISEAIRDERTTTQTDLFKPTLWAVASWLIFRVAHSLRIHSDMLVVRALKISQLTDSGTPPTYDSMHQELEFGNFGEL
jgi:hypothetical protein